MIVKDAVCPCLPNAENERIYRFKTMTIEVDKKLDWVALTKWKEHFRYPSQGTMRNITARREENGAGAFLSMVNGRFYVNVEKFHQWMEKQSQFRRSNG